MRRKFYIGGVIRWCNLFVNSVLFWYDEVDAPGEVAEWSNALDLKSSEPKGSVGSNPTLSVLIFNC
jgi:hypothetical protein